MIIKAEAEDLQAIAALNTLAYREIAARVPAWSSEEFFHSLVVKRAQYATFYLLRRDNQVIGSVGYSRPGNSVDPIPAYWASVLLLAVHPEYRGNGYGRLLVSECMARAQQDRAETLGLFTSELMVTARLLYEKLGFRMEHEIAPRLGLRYWLYRYDYPC